MRTPSPGAVLRLGLAAVLVASDHSPATAQAWVPFRGEGTLSIGYQHFDGGDHLFATDALDGISSVGYVAEGDRWYLGDTSGHTVEAGVDFGVLDRTAFSAALAFVATRYEGRAPVAADDDGDWHGALQDLRLGVRYQIVTAPVAVTPSFSLVTPLSDYETDGHSSQGRGLTEVQVGLAVGTTIPGLAHGWIQAGYRYSFPEAVEGKRFNVSQLDLGLGYRLAAGLSGHVLALFRETHGGSEWITLSESGELQGHGDASQLHIRTADVDAVHAGAALSWSVSRSLGVHVGWTTMISGQNTEDADVIAFGTSWGFASPWAR